MKNSLKALCLAALVTLAAKPAFAFGVGADLGMSRIMNGDGKNGFGADIYLRILPLPIPLVTPEIQIGMHRFTFEGGGGIDDITVTNMPIMVGGRFGLPIPVMSPWVDAHIGLNRATSSFEGSEAENSLGFNVGAGIELLNLPLIALGLGAHYYIIQPSGDAPEGSESAKMFTIGVDGSIGF